MDTNRVGMNEDEYAEHLILSSLENCHFNPSFNDSNQTNQRHDSHHNDLLNCELPEDIVSTVSLTTDDDLLDDIDLFDAESFSDDAENDGPKEVEKKRVLSPPSPVSSSVTATPAPVAVSPKYEVSTKEQTPSRRTSVKTNSNGAVVRVETPTEYDILCGQSRVCSNHRGNKCFQVVLDQFAERYDAATTKQEKMTMTKEVVSILHNAGGRFLKLKDGAWEEISNVAARDKVSHALRTKVASWKRQQRQLSQNGLGGSDAPSRRRSSSSISLMASKSKHRRSSISSVASNIMTSSFHAGNIDDSSATVFGDLMAAQREIFQTLSSSSSSFHPHHHRSGSNCEPLYHQQQQQHVTSRRSSSLF